MRPGTLLAIVSGASIWTGPSLLFSADRDSTPAAAPPPPITFLYVPEHDADGSPAESPSFWATNHTDKTLAVSLTAIEVRGDSGWISRNQYGRPSGVDIYFQTSQGRQRDLPPHTGAYGELETKRMVLPQDLDWRAKASVAERLSGMAELGSQMEASRRLLQLRLSTGNTNVPYHAIGKGHAAYEYKWTVLSQEVAPEPAAEKLRPKPAASVPDLSRPPASAEALAKAREAVRKKLSEVEAEQGAARPGTNTAQ